MMFFCAPLRIVVVVECSTIVKDSGTKPERTSTARVVLQILGKCLSVTRHGILVVLNSTSTRTRGACLAKMEMPNREGKA